MLSFMAAGQVSRATLIEMLVVGLALRQRTQSEFAGLESRWTLLEVQGAESRVRSPRGAQQLLAPIGFPRAHSASQQWEGTRRGHPVQGLGTKQPRLSQSHPASLPFYVCPMLRWHPPTAGGDKNSPVKKSAEPLGKSGTGTDPLCGRSDQSGARKLERRSHGVNFSISVECGLLFSSLISDAKQKMSWFLKSVLSKGWNIMTSFGISTREGF